MAKLPSALHPGSQALSPWLIVLLVILLQVALWLGFVYLSQESNHATTQTEMLLISGYSALAVLIALIVAFSRQRWIERENRIRQRLLDVIDAIPDPSAVRDAKGKYVLWNKAAETYHGIKAIHVIGKTPFELFPPAVARSILELDALCAEQQSTVVQRVELPPLYGKGSRVASIRVAPIRTVDDAGSVRGAVTILHDITEEEKEARRLRQTTVQLKAALLASGFGMWHWDLRSQAVNYDAGYKQLLRYAGQQFETDFLIKERIHAQDWPRVKAATQASLTDQQPFDIRYRLMCFDGVYREFRSCGEVSRLPNGDHYFAGLLCSAD